MDIAAMRSELTQLYSGTEWAKKVRNMGPRQVIAVYMNCKRSGKFHDMFDAFSGRPMGTLVDLPDPKPNPYHQMSIFEYMREKGEKVC